MKTMELNPMAVSLNESEEKEMNFKDAAKSFLKATSKVAKAIGRILFVISPVYPQYMESLKRESNA